MKAQRRSLTRVSGADEICLPRSILTGGVIKRINNLAGENGQGTTERHATRDLYSADGRSGIGVGSGLGGGAVSFRMAFYQGSKTVKLHFVPRLVLVDPQKRMF